MNNINKIKVSHLCYGCGTCNVVCGHQAITMHYDNIGRLLPTIDESKCTNCGLCYNHCPSLDLKGIQMPDTDDKYVGHVENVYIGKATEERIYRNSQSGGLVTATIKYLFESDKIDAAIMCKVEDAIEYTAKAVVITSADDLYACQKSSYVPIDIVSALKDVEKYNSIAIVGTGCHIQGVKAIEHFSRKYKDKIRYKLGLICDRTLCKTVTDVLYGGNFKEQPKRLVWRDKSLDYKTARLLISTLEGEIKEVPRWKRFSLKDPFTSPRCRICFDKLNTNSDIVYGDPWGMNNVDWKNGMSVVITRTLDAKKIIDEMLEDFRIELFDAKLEDVIRGQYIEKRKKDVSSALMYFKNHNFLLPSYTAKLQPAQENRSISNLIDNFIIDSSLQPQKIVYKNKFFLIKTGLKGSIRNVLNKIVCFFARIFKICEERQ